jgi:signal peptidase I
MQKIYLYIGICTTIAFGLKMWVIEGYTIPSASMQPTLNIGDWVWIKKLPIYAPKRGELIAFTFPQDNKTQLIKRCIGLPTDSIVRINGQYTLQKNNPNAYVIPQKGQKLTFTKENFGFYQPLIQHYEKIQAGLIGDKIYINNQINDTYTFTQNYYYALGDNQDNSYDSEDWGLIPERCLIGKAFFIWKK